MLFQDNFACVRPRARAKSAAACSNRAQARALTWRQRPLSLGAPAPSLSLGARARSSLSLEARARSHLAITSHLQQIGARACSHSRPLFATNVYNTKVMALRAHRTPPIGRGWRVEVAEMRSLDFLEVDATDWRAGLM